MRAVRPAGGEVAACDRHLADAMRMVTPEHNGETNDTHIVVRRLEVAGPACAICGDPATWVLIPQAVLR
jgi:hypothetical protein